MRVRWSLGVLILFSLFSALLGQSLVSSILNAHGGAQNLTKASSYQISGTVTRDGRSTPFLLKADGENTRFERATGVSIKRGMVEQLTSNGRRSDIRPVRHGAQDLYLVPFLALRELSSTRQPAASRVRMPFSVARASSVLSRTNQTFP